MSKQNVFSFDKCWIYCFMEGGRVGGGWFGVGVGEGWGRALVAYIC